MANEYKFNYMTNEYKLSYTAKEVDELLKKIKNLEEPTYEEWVFTYKDGTTETRMVCFKND